MNNISYNEIMIALCLSMLIYNYNENKYFIIEDGHTLGDFYKIIDFHFDIYQREALNYLYNICPDGKMVKFINDKERDIQCGIISSEKNKKLNIVFRGTDSFTDCLYDSLFCKTYCVPITDPINGIFANDKFIVFTILLLVSFILYLINPTSIGKKFLLDLKLIFIVSST